MQPDTSAPSAAYIVVVDRHLAVRQGLATCFEPDGYVLVFLPGGAGALAVIGHLQPAVALIDLHLEYPYAGLDVVRALRAEAATRALPLIVWSTDTDAECRVAALHLPQVRVVSKADDPTTLRAAIAAAARSGARRDAHGAREHVVG